jgi:uncharacterized glyoxalase superfamily protein PhnB
MSDQHTSATPGPLVHFKDATPILRVTDFDASVAYYTGALGFTLAWSVGRFGSVERGHAAIMLCEGSQGAPGTWVYIGISDADAFHEQAHAAGARIRNPPSNYPWGSREVHVFDPDGHVLRFGSSFPEGAPLGQWLDEDGVRWQAHEDHTWTRVD